MSDFKRQRECDRKEDSKMMLADPSDPVWLTLTMNLVPPVISGLLSGLSGILVGLAIQKRTNKDQEKRDTLAYQRDTANRNATYLYDAYRAIRQLVGAYEHAIDAIAPLSAEDEESNNVKRTANENIQSKLQDAEAEISAYALINKEQEIHTALTAVHLAYQAWLSDITMFRRLQGANSIVDPLSIMPYETVVKDRENFDKKRDALLTIAKAWESLI